MIAASSGAITTMGGDGTAGFNGDNIPATAAELGSPNGEAIDSAGNVYFAEQYSSRVRKVSASTGLITTVAGTGQAGYNGDNIPAATAELAIPSSVAVDAAGNLYIADQFNERIRKVSASTGMITTVAGNGNTGFNGDSIPATGAELNTPSGVALDGAGNLYIADQYNGRIREVTTSTGMITTVAGNGDLYDHGDNVIATSVGTFLPANVAADAAGNFFIIDGSRIRKVTASTGIITTVAGGGGEGSDNIPATTSQLISPDGLAVDSAGNLYISTSDRIRKISSSTGIITTVAGNGSYGYNGDNIPATTAELAGPSGLTLGPSGNVYFSDGGSNRVPLLIVQGACASALSAGGLALSAVAGTGTITVTAPPGCTWNISGAPSWVTFTSSTSGTANGMVTFQLSENTGAALTGNFTIGGLEFTIDQATGATSAFNLIGSMAQLASGGGWETTLNLVNTGSSPGEALINLWGDPGGSLQLPFSFPQSATAPSPLLGATLDEALAPNAPLILDSQQPNNATSQVGSAQLMANGNIDGFAIFRFQPSGQEAVVPLEKRNAPSYVLPFDNTGGLSTGVAVENVSGTAANVPVVLRDDTGATVGTTTLALEAYGHTSFLLAQNYAATAGIRGTVEFDAPPAGLYSSAGQISVLGLRSAPIGASHTDFAVTTVPVLANVTAGSGSMAHVAAGFGWQTTFTLVNVGTTSAEAHLAFFDNNGAPLALSLNFPQSGDNVTESTVDATIAAGATSIITAIDTDVSLVGSAQMTTTGSISGFAIFRYNATGQEAVVPLETGSSNGYLLIYDNTNGLSTGVAIANVSGQAANVPVIVRDDTGATLSTSTISLSANGHTMFLLADATSGFPVTAGKRGTVEFYKPAGGQIGIVGLRSSPIGNGFAVTTIPPLASH